MSKTKWISAYNFICRHRILVISPNSISHSQSFSFGSYNCLYQSICGKRTHLTPLCWLTPESPVTLYSELFWRKINGNKKRCFFFLTQIIIKCPVTFFHNKISLFHIFLLMVYAYFTTNISFPRKDFMYFYVFSI